MKDLSSRPLHSFGVLQCYATLLVRPQSFIPAWRYIYTAATKFFLFQFLRKFRIIRTKIVHVDHELDDCIPFKPELLDIYLDFINFWLRPISMMQQKFGVRKGTEIANKFLFYITRAYSEAYNLYKKCMTTTNQPKTDCTGLKIMRIMDPHYLCVPSLHIAVVTLTISFYRQLFDQDLFSENEKKRWMQEIETHGIEIADSVLYLKQHSVNCIPAALYMMSRITPELVSPVEAVQFLDKLLQREPTIDAETHKKIIEHIQFIYERFLLEGTTEDDWREPILRWLESYEPYQTN